MLTPTVSKPGVDPDAEFWSQTDELAHVHRFARSRGASHRTPTLGSSAAKRHRGCVDPRVWCCRRPSARQVSLNLFTDPGRPDRDPDKDISQRRRPRRRSDFHQTVGNGVIPVDDDTPMCTRAPGKDWRGVFAGGKGMAAEDPRAPSGCPTSPPWRRWPAVAGRDPGLPPTPPAAYIGQPIGFRNSQKEPPPPSTRTPTGCACPSVCNPRRRVLPVPRKKQFTATVPVAAHQRPTRPRGPPGPGPDPLVHRAAELPRRRPSSLLEIPDPGSPARSWHHR